MRAGCGSFDVTCDGRPHRGIHRGFPATVRGRPRWKSGRAWRILIPGSVSDPAGRRSRRRPGALFLALFIFLSVPARAADAVETSGDVLRVAIPLAAYGVAWGRDDDEGRRRFAWAFAGTLASTLALKKAVDQEGPDGQSEAFPSGHAATAFAGAAFLQRRYGWRSAWPAWLGAAYTGWTRVHADEHDVEDVVAGAALAVAWNWWLVAPADHLQVQPVVDAGGVGLRLDWRY